MNNRKVILSGSIWTSASTITTAVVEMLRLSILAHFVAKSDFGIVAILTMVLGFTNMFSELGFSTVLLHKKEVTDKEFSSLYWAQFIVYSAIYAIVSACGFMIADFFNEPSITHLLPIAMLDLILYGVGRLYDTVLQKELKFDVLAKRNIISSIVSLVAAAVLAYKGFGVYSLILSTLIKTTILNVWNLVLGFRSMTLRPYLSLRLIKPMFTMGLNQTGSHILDYISTKIDVFIIGKMLGSEVLGVYNLAKELIIKGTMFVNSIVNRVSFPLFAKKQDDKDSLRRNYCKLLSFISLFNFPICTIVGTTGCLIVPVIYGDLYSDAIPIVYILSLWGYFSCIGNPVGNIVVATGRTDLSLRYTIIRFLCFIPIMSLLSIYNIYVLAWGSVLLYFIFTFISWYMHLYITIQLKVKQFAASFMAPCIYSILLGGVGYILMNHLNQNNANNLTILGAALLWCIIYLIIFAYIQKNSIKEIKKMILK